VQEVERLDGRPLAGDTQPLFSDRVADPAFPRRAISVFGYSETTLRAVDNDNTMYWFRRYEASRRGLQFQVIASWPWATKSRDTSYRQVHEGLDRHRDWVRQRPTVLLGDLNVNAAYRGRLWPDLFERLQELGLVSAYHEFSGEPFGEETSSTFFRRGSVPAGHLDYCFLPKSWAPRITGVQVGSCEDWRDVSDHVPVVVDLDL
jgi:endonuclease/exonuclease/phosphatase family metal-dependent hydrolase